jgi:hypothetical protein
MSRLRHIHHHQVVSLVASAAEAAGAEVQVAVAEQLVASAELVKMAQEMAAKVA